MSGRESSGQSGVAFSEVSQAVDRKAGVLLRTVCALAVLQILSLGVFSSGPPSLNEPPSSSPTLRRIRDKRYIATRKGEAKEDKSKGN